MRCLKLLLVLILGAESAGGYSQSPVTPLELANVRDIGGNGRGAISVSGDGQWIAFQLQSPNAHYGTIELSWMVIPTAPGHTPTRIADGGNVLLNPSLGAVINGSIPPIRALWAPDSRRFAYLLNRAGSTQIWLSNVDEVGQEQITSGPADVIDFLWSEDGSFIYFESGLSESDVQQNSARESSSGYRADDRFVPWMSPRPVQRVCGILNGRINAVGLDRECEPAIWTYDFADNAERRASEEEIEDYRLLRRGGAQPTGLSGRTIQNLRSKEELGRYAWLENVDPETYVGPYAPLRLRASIEGRSLECAHEQCRGYQSRGHQDLWWSQNGEEIIFLRRDGPSHSQTGVYAWNLSTNGLQQIYQSDGWLTDCEMAEDRLVCLYESWTQPRTIVSLSLGDGSISTLFDPNPAFRDRQFSRIEKLEWEDEFGNSTYGHLVYPDNYEQEQSYPLVIVTYQSRGFLRGGVGNEYPIHPLAAAGFFVLSHEMPFDIELISRSDDFNNQLYEDLYVRRSVLSSQERVVESLVSQGLVDSNRIAITGLSEGASQTNYALIHSNLFAVGISSSMAFSPGSYHLMNGQMRDYWRWLLNGPPDDPKSYWREISLGLNAERVSAPLLVNVSDQEMIGTHENYARLREANHPIEMYVYPGEYHVKWRPDHRLSIFRRNIQWLQFWLQGVESDAPVDPEQYQRWRQMRIDRCAMEDFERPIYCDFARNDDDPDEASSEPNLEVGTIE